MQDKKHKIALIGYQLHGGGLEKSMSQLSVFFGNFGFEVHDIVLEDSISYPYSGVLVNLKKTINAKNKFIEKIKIFFFLKKYLKSNNFDFIIDFRYRINPISEFLFSEFIYNSRTIYTVYSSRIETYLPKPKWLAKLIAKNKYSIVCNANEIKNLLLEKYNLTNCDMIYSAIEFDEIARISSEKIEFEFEYIVAAGRFDYTNVKQFDQLIIAYSKSDLPNKNIKLVLLGDGERQEFLESVAETNGILESVVFAGFQSNPYKFFKNAKFLVLCSKYEGFGMVLTESLACGTPVISFDCVSGPKEIIVHKENGLLVENQNFEALTKAMNLFIEDEKLYLNCKKNAVSSVQKFDLEKIGKQWLNLLKIDVNS